MDVEGIASLNIAQDVQVNTTESEERQLATEQIANEQTQSASEETEELAKELLAIVCRNGGNLEVENVVGSLSQVGNEFVNKHGFYPIRQSSLGNVLVLEVKEKRGTFKVKVDIELCKDYANTECLLSECRRLHVCPQFVKGQCELDDDGNSSCNLNHNFSNEHEEGILRKLKLDSLHEGSLLPLLRNAIFGVSEGISEGILSDLEVCLHYNSVPGCPTGASCLNLHLCAAFAKGECGKRADACMKSHDVVKEKSRLTKILEQQTIKRREINFQNLLRIARTAALTQAAPPSVDEICSFHLKGNCRYGRLCKKYWSLQLPYLWQITVTLEDDSEKWIHFPPLYNEMIEWDYCNVSNDTSFDINFGGGPGALLNVCFDEMVAKTRTGDHSVKIRRLSTASWVKASPGDCFGTRWTWYWRNDQEQWVTYDGANLPVTNAAQNQNSSSNEILEENYLSGAQSFTLSQNGQSYNIDLKNFQQTNTVTSKSRKIRRRPTKFIGTKHTTTILRRNYCQPSPGSPSSRPVLPTSTNVTLPQGWTAMPAGQDVAMVTLQPGSVQYNHVQREFKKTLNGKTIHKIERVQNLDLWESYSRKLSKLSRKLGRPVEVRQLFHGTSENAVKAICQQGFDWRVNGSHGTACGKGTYFAVQASYSDTYSGMTTTGHKMMFLNKVIVGLYTVGNTNTVRPPARDPSKPYELYHSCVNNMTNPVMFVVFENDQSYPEFVISYS